ncbi:hypothetical protein H6P81_008088 [Aristolochia fimbriata]|uniref:Uncharacterized protein n=1 Tax=Aristolochia fimbriata TaxID=158543 RepID=A0AAV7F3E7_ARIFI|nr:hypothetical protein H6P81_008088 [Aristolochia fimbriata]
MKLSTVVFSLILLPSIICLVDVQQVSAGREPKVEEQKIMKKNIDHEDDVVICPQTFMCNPPCIGKIDGEECVCDCKQVNHPQDDLYCPTAGCPPNCIERNDGDKCWCDCT